MSKFIINNKEFVDAADKISFRINDEMWMRLNVTSEREAAEAAFDAEFGIPRCISRFTAEEEKEK